MLPTGFLAKRRVAGALHEKTLTSKAKRALWTSFQIIAMPPLTWMVCPVT